MAFFLKFFIVSYWILLDFLKVNTAGIYFIIIRGSNSFHLDELISYRTVTEQGFAPPVAENLMFCIEHDKI